MTEIAMINFARRFRVATTGLADVLSPSQVRAFSDCELRWFYEHLLGLPEPPIAMQALDRAIRAALMANFRHKLDSKEDLQAEGVVGLFRRACACGVNERTGPIAMWSNYFGYGTRLMAYRKAHPVAPVWFRESKYLVGY